MPRERVLWAVHRDLAYVSAGHPRQRLDLYLPERTGPLPLLVYVHGGAFRGGDKGDGPALEYLDEGYALASINYRLSQHAVFPAQIEDCKAAVRWLRAHAGEYRLDPDHMAIGGTSAGGHLAAMVGTTGLVRDFDVGEHLDRSSRVQAVVDYFGPTDFLQMDTHRLPGGMVHDGPTPLTGADGRVRRCLQRRSFLCTTVVWGPRGGRLAYHRVEGPRAS